MISLIFLVPLFPLVGFLILGIFGKYLNKESIIGFIGNLTVFLSFLLTVLIFFEWIAKNYEEPHIVTLFPWISTGEFNVNWAYQVDQLSITFALIVTGVGFLIHLYSIGYMHNDRSFYRFFAYMNLFIFYDA